MSDVVGERLERMARFVKRMNEVERDLSSHYVRPKDAATLILVDRSGRVPKVLLGKRHHGHKFMPGKFVFPGGRVDPADQRMPIARTLHPRTENIPELVAYCLCERELGRRHRTFGGSRARLES